MPGANLLNGGRGIDTVSYEHATSAVTVNLGSTSAPGHDRRGARYADGDRERDRLGL